MVFTLARAAYAQLFTASVTGIIRDPAENVVPDALVVVRNVETETERRTLSNSAGNYLIVNLLPGRYTLSTSKPGFSTSNIREFNLAVDQRATVDVALELGQLEQSVDVQATGEAIQSTTAELGYLVNAKQVQSLPLDGRNFTQLLSLSPGVAPVSVGQNAWGFEAPVTSGAQFVFPAINGQTNRSNLFLLDGFINEGTCFPW